MRSKLFFLSLFTCLLENSVCFGALIYDFQSPGATVLDGLTQGTFTVSGVPLDVQSGTFTTAGVFAPGDQNSKLSVSSDGLGMTSDIAGGDQIQADTTLAGVHDGVLFTFDPLFVPTEISLTRFSNLKMPD